MIKKLKLKFILTASIALAVLLFLILLTVNAINFGNVASDADNITLNIINNGGEIGGFKDRVPPSESDDVNDQEEKLENYEDLDERFKDRPEMPYDTRYFYVEFNGEDATKVKTDRIFAVNDNEAVKLSKEVYSKERVGWSGSYRYRVKDVNGIRAVTFVDYSRELAPSFTVLWTSLIVFGSGILISVVAIFFISNLVIKPVEESIHKQKRFVSNASHELKTPITIIKMNNELLEMQVGSENENVEAIDKQANRLTDIVKDLNALAKLDEQEHFNFTTLNLSNIVNKICDDVRPQFESRGKKIEVKIQNDISIKGNESMVTRLVEVALDNALKYSKSFTKVTLDSNGQRIKLKVLNDSIVPIDEGPLDKVFERFYRSDEARGSDIEGSGIGLSMAKEIVENHKGRISAYGEKGIFNLKIYF